MTSVSVKTASEGFSPKRIGRRADEFNRSKKSEARSFSEINALASRCCDTQRDAKTGKNYEPLVLYNDDNDDSSRRCKKGKLRKPEGARGDRSNPRYGEEITGKAVVRNASLACLDAERFESKRLWMESKRG